MIAAVVPQFFFLSARLLSMLSLNASRIDRDNFTNFDSIRPTVKPGACECPGLT